MSVICKVPVRITERIVVKTVLLMIVILCDSSFG